MSALSEYARLHNSLEPPIPGSSVPRCPCQRAEPCPCEAFTRRLEQRHRKDQELMIGVSESLKALAGVADSEMMRRGLLSLADKLF